MMRLKILAFDQSGSHTGFAVHVEPSEPRDMIVGSFSCKHGKDGNEKAQIFARNVKALIALYRPDFIAWERAKPNISAYEKKSAAQKLVGGEEVGGWTVNAGQLILPEIQGIIRGMAKAYGIPSASAYPAVWRAAVIGGGAGRLTTELAKEAARQTCAQMRIKFANEHEAEAALIALWAGRCQEFKLYRYRREKREATAA